MKTRNAFRFYPTERQKRQFAKEFGCARHAYNFALRLRSDSFKEGKTINYAESSREWTKHRNDPAFGWLRESSSVPQQQAVRNLQTAFANFFAKRSRYPAFKSKHGPQSAEYTSNAFKWDPLNRNLSISKVGHLRVKWSRTFTSTPSTVTITKDCSGRYFVSLCLDEPRPEPLPKTGEAVGIDLGINRLATFSTGEFVANPRYTAKYAKRLAKAHRVLSRRKKGSNRRNAQKLRVARIYSRVADSRKDCLDKLTTRLVRRFDVIAIEDLNIRGMVRNHNLAAHIDCASFGAFRRMLEYKCDWYGKEVWTADRFFPSSKRCNTCGHIHQDMPLNVRQFNCVECGTQHDRDMNAAKNILQFAKAASPTTAGQAGSYGRGERVRRTGASASGRGARRSVNQPGAVNV